MILTIDIENKNIVVGCFDGEKLVFIERISTGLSTTALEYTVTLRAVLDIHGIKQGSVDGGIISSVVPSVTAAVKSAAENITGREIPVLVPGMKTGLSILIDDPAQLGSNLVAGAVAGINLYKPPMIIIDMGTAVTFSVIDEKKCYIGGLIMPGIRSSLDSLIAGTSLLANISITPPKKLIASNTADCLKSGAIYSSASSIDGIVDRIEDELGAACSVIATGTGAKLITEQCRHDIIVDDDLLLKGLMLIYKKTAESSAF